MENVKNKFELSRLDSKLLQAIESKQHCLFIPSLPQGWDDEQFRFSVRQKCQAAQYPVIEMQGSFVSAENLLFSLIDRRPQSRLQFEPELSAYRKLCTIIDHTEPSVIAVYDAHKLNPDGVQIVARVARYLKRNLSNWKIILLSDEDSFNKANHFQLPLDMPFTDVNLHFIAEHKINFKLISSLLLGILGIAALVFIFTSQRPQSTNDEEGLFTQAHEKPTENGQKIQAAGSSPTDSTVFKRSSDSNWLSNEEFNQIIARLNKPPSTEIAVVTDAPSPVNKQPKKLLSEKMIAAIQLGDSNKLKKLIAQGESLSAATQKRQTPLILASINGNTSLVKWLIDQGAAVNDQDIFGRTALYYTAVHGNLDTAEILLEQGADSNLASSLNKTPLMAAVHNDYVKLADLLLHHAARIDVRDHSGWSAIFYAVWNDNFDMVNRLMENQPNLSSVDTSGNSLAVIAKARNHAQILRVLNLD